MHVEHILLGHRRLLVWCWHLKRLTKWRRTLAWLLCLVVIATVIFVLYSLGGVGIDDAASMVRPRHPVDALTNGSFYFTSRHTVDPARKREQESPPRYQGGTEEMRAGLPSTCAGRCEFWSGADGGGERGFTVLTMTYQRTDTLPAFLQHYAAMGGVSKIILVWNNIGQKPPSDLYQATRDTPLVIKEQTKNLIRNRLQDHAEIDTDGVFVIDDDLLFSEKDVKWAFTAWLQNKEKLIGFVPRHHVRTENGSYHYGEHASPSNYSMILTGAAFLHRLYLSKFAQIPSVAKKMIDEKQNCEDITMNFIVAITLYPQPVGYYVHFSKVKKLDRIAKESWFRGLWRTPGHKEERSRCMNELVSLYGRMPLTYTNIVIYTYKPHSRPKSKLKKQ